jgi:hypothetical protein
MAGDTRIYLAIGLQEKNRAWQFVREQSLSNYNCEPGTEQPELLFAAERDGKIVGTVGLDFYEPGKRIELEDHFDFHQENFLWPACPENLALYSSWRASCSHVAPLLVYASAKYALDHGKFYALCELKKGVIKRLERLNIEVRPVPGSRLSLEHISPEKQEYYKTDPPQLCLISFCQMCSALLPIYQAYKNQFAAAGRRL